MSSLRLAIALLRIPRLFGALFLFPLLISIVVVFAQILFTALMVQTLNNVATPVEQRVERLEDKNFGRLLVYGHGETLPPIRVCRWVADPASQSGVEQPPSPDCRPGRLDVALRVDDPAAFNPEKYSSAFNGNVERLHICRSCRPDIVITDSHGQISSDIYSVWGLIVVNLVRFNTSYYVESLKEIQQVEEIFGQRTLHLPGFAEAINLNRALTALAITVNFSGIIIIALWLALKAHRKVLDYFSHSGALLPMVAATGHSSFYSALWVLTLCRVGAFFGAALPMTYFGFIKLISRDDLDAFFGGGRIVLWLIVLTSSLGLATLIASIAELKHRHSLLSFTYKYVPLIVCFIGGLLWGGTFLVESSGAHLVRFVTTAAPLLGTTPILLSPVFRPDASALVLHFLLSIGMLALALRYNSRWFAAHLEEI